MTTIEEEISELCNRLMTPFPYEDLRDIMADFENEFKKYASNETITADFNTYMMYILGMATSYINRIEDALERFNMRERLVKSFFDWFPKYRFLEPYDLKKYTNFYSDYLLLDELRLKLVIVIDRNDFEKIQQ